MQHGRPAKKFAEYVRIFCLTIHFYSPTAYEYIRSTFDQHLPCIRTIRSWYSSVNGSPGFTQAAFDVLRQRSKDLKTKNEQLVGSIIFDEVAIRRQSQYDKAKQRFMGHITAGKPVEFEDCSPLAKEALVFMFSAITPEEFKIPIAYFLTTGLCAEEKVALLNECMYRLYEAGVVLASLTFDGVITNIRTVKLLGADFESNKPYFQNPYDRENKVYVILDAPHMLKLWRNCLGNRGTLFNNEKKIEWKYFVSLVKLQLENKINLGNKLTKTHLEFEDKKMNVRIAAETLSNSTADSIQFANSVLKLDMFKGSEETEEYFRVANNLFDIMNTKKNHGGKQFKRPICESTEREFNEYFEYARKYLRSLHIVENGVRVSVFASKCYTPFFGFNYNTFSFMGIYSNYIKPQNSEFFTFSVSQDHVESFFGCIRRMNGCNDNPNAQQFEGAYRKLLVNNEIKSGAHSNCLNDVTQILNVSSRPNHRSAQLRNNIEIAKQLDALQDRDFISGFDRFDDVESALNADKENYDMLEMHSKAFLATKLEAKVLKCIFKKGKMSCDTCMEVFAENEREDDKFIEFKSVRQPCKSTINIIRRADELLKRHESEPVSIQAIFIYIFRNIDMDSLYTASEFNCGVNHKDEFIRLIIRTYLDIKSTNVAKVLTRSDKPRLIRHNMIKNIQRAGQ